MSKTQNLQGAKLGFKILERLLELRERIRPNEN